ncbi:protein PRRC1 isoform X2 [Nasonia vitripennis]|uniref:Non-canonical purine NTP phosphatase/PRRC1 domain-containing protein n=1 Tax=Nasonia vitripennis TaxID=7425 RepID=A0A7M7Q2G9_NASVI|nr:protein PRRC1 isoform X2 [Nasonia vitripennis]
MTDESNGESGFEFVEKKPEDFSESVAPKPATATADTATTPASPGATPPTAVTTPLSLGNILSKIAPPTALPTFITNSMSISPASSPAAQTEELIKSENVKTPTESPEGVQTTEPTASTFEYKGPQVLIAPDSPTMDTSALAGSLFTWVKDTVANSNVLSKVAEKAKNSVNSMITTLDPQMHSGGDIEIIVASDKDAKVAPIREAFQNVFGNATVTGTKVETAPAAAQPVGFAAGVKAAQERIAGVRKNPSIPADIPIVAVENFILEVGQDKWYDLGVIILEDVKQKINLQTFTQMTPVPSQIVETAQESTPKDYSKDGLAVTIGSLMGANLQVSHTEWHSALTGVSRKDIVFLAAQSLAGIYKNTINPIKTPSVCLKNNWKCNFFD